METVVDPEPTALERALLDALLAGDHPFLAALRLQYSAAVPVSRESSGAGFFLSFAVPPHIPRVTPPGFTVSDVFFDLGGLPDGGGGAALFVRDGAIAFLEIYTMVGAWPREEGEWSIHYLHGTRDLDQLSRELRGHFDIANR